MLHCLYQASRCVYGLNWTTNQNIWTRNPEQSKTAVTIRPSASAWTRWVCFCWCGTESCSNPNLWKPPGSAADVRNLICSIWAEWLINLQPTLYLWRWTTCCVSDMKERSTHYQVQWVIQTFERFSKMLIKKKKFRQNSILTETGRKQRLK